jgi:NAD(P)-dependent dehydrogenase (short-subunit alcohol dehydrogenase family)
MKPAGPRLSGKVALVTGGATGIGRATVLALAREGAAVAVNYSKSKAAAHETAKLAEEAGVRALPIQADVTQDAQVRAMCDEVARELGGLDCLVNNAAWTQRVPHRQLEDLTDEIWDRVVATNLRAPFYCARAAVPHMERRGGGAIVNITSVATFTGTGSRPRPGSTRSRNRSPARSRPFASGSTRWPRACSRPASEAASSPGICSPRSAPSRRSAARSPWTRPRRRWCSCSPARP